MGIGDWAQSPIPNPQFYSFFYIYILIYNFLVNIILLIINIIKKMMEKKTFLDKLLRILSQTRRFYEVI